MRTWLVPRAELLPDQLRAIELEPTEHRLIAGPPGSGKTQVLLHRAAYLRERLHSDSGRFRIFVFTNSLKRYIRSALHLLDLPESCVWGFDAWCVGFYRRRISPVLPEQGDEDGTPDFAAIRAAVAERVRAEGSRAKLYDFVMVDEGQDLDASAFAIVTAIAGHVTVCTDAKQQIYDGGSDEAEIARGLGIRRRNIALLEAFRCSPYIAELAAEFVPDAEERAGYLRQVRTEQSEREQPVVLVGLEPPDELAFLEDALRTRLARSERVGILVPKRRVMAEIAAALRGRGIEVETPERMDFAGDRPKVMPYHSAKGITLDSVLLPGLQTENFRRYTPARVERLLFVAITRAQAWAGLSTVVEDTQVFAPLQRLLAPRRGRHWAVQDVRAIPPVYGAASPPPAPPEDDLTSLL